MIDKNGKLFGKLNIIDLLIILIIIAAAIFLGMRIFGGDEDMQNPARTVRMTFYAPDAPAVLEGKASAGDPVIDFDNSRSLGTLTAYDTEPAITYVVNPQTGEPVEIPVADECRLTLTCETIGYLSVDGLHVNDCTYCIGGSYTIRAGQTRVACRLADVEVVG